MAESGIFTKSGMRTNYLEKDTYYMAVAFLSAKRSKDPVTQVGACIVNEDGRIVGVGYNGTPNGIDDKKMPWGKDPNNHDNIKQKMFYVCHAEMNAIVNKYQADIKGSKIYVSLFPCNECAKIIIQSGIEEVIYYSDKKKDDPKFKASRKMLEQAGVELRELDEKENIVIDFQSTEDCGKESTSNKRKKLR